MAKAGRPSLGVKPTTVQLPEGIPERIDALVGKQKRSEFIRIAIEAAVMLAELAKNSPAKDE